MMTDMNDMDKFFHLADPEDALQGWYGLKMTQQEKAEAVERCIEEIKENVPVKYAKSKPDELIKKTCEKYQVSEDFVRLVANWL